MEDYMYRVLLLSAGILLAGSIAHAQEKPLELVPPEYGCPMKLPDETVLLTHCSSLSETACFADKRCKWKHPDESATVARCDVRAGAYNATPSVNPKELAKFYPPLPVPVLESEKRVVDQAMARAANSGMSKKYGDAVSIYSRTLDSLEDNSTYRSVLLARRGVAYEYLGQKDKALIDYCMSVASATDYNSEELSRTRILQLVDPNASKTTLPQFARAGVVKTTIRRPIMAKLSVTGPEGEDYVVKLGNAENEREVIYIYVRGGAVFETKVPLGSYRLQYARGSIWYGVKELFGPDTEFYKMYVDREAKNEVYDFNRHGNKISGWTFRLRAAEGGNTVSGRISKEEFGSVEE